MPKQISLTSYFSNGAAANKKKKQDQKKADEEDSSVKVRSTTTKKTTTTTKQKKQQEEEKTTTTTTTTTTTLSKKRKRGNFKSLLPATSTTSAAKNATSSTKTGNTFIKFHSKAQFKSHARKICLSNPRYTYDKFDPTMEIYDQEDIELKHQGEIPYLFLASALDAVSEVSSRIEKTQRMANCFRTILHQSSNPERDLVVAVYLCTNNLGSAYEGIELGIGESLLMKSLAETTGKSLANIKRLLQEEGDLGLIAQKVRAKQNTLTKPKPLSINKVFDSFQKIAAFSGKNSQQHKVNKIKLLLGSSRDCEAQYIIRSLQGKMRVGLGDETVPVSLTHAVMLAGLTGDITDLKQGEEIMKATYAQHPNYDDIIPQLLEHGLEDLEERCPLTPGIPVKPMLAKPTKSIKEVFQRLEKNFTIEWKYDGERAQIHLMPDGKVEIYSRRLERHTLKYPDLIHMLPKTFKTSVKSAILDCEVVAFDRENKRIEAFQVLTTRGRKDVDMKNITVSVCLFAFDLLYLNGDSYLKKTLRERRQALFDNFQEVDDEFRFVQYKDTEDESEIQRYLEESVTGNCEGLMVKSLDTNATYEPSRRSFNWLKMKKDYIQGLGDSVDLVPIGGYMGTGKRVGTYGGYLLAVFDPHTEEFQSVCKIGSGFSDSQLKEFYKRFSEQYVIPAPLSSYQIGNLGKDMPQVWFDAREVWEVQCADLSLSPIYQAGIGTVNDSKGIALRFPRFIRIREDKAPEDATTADQIADMYNSQAIVMNSRK